MPLERVGAYLQLTKNSSSASASTTDYHHDMALEEANAGKMRMALRAFLALLVAAVRAHDAWESAQWSGQYSDPYVRADHPQLKVHAQNGTLVELKVLSLLLSASVEFATRGR